MKATDLMIGDWVQFTGTSKIRSRINCISPNQQHVAHTDNATWIDSFDMIEPVPITDEILEANGFISLNYDSCFVYRTSFEEDFEITKDNKGFHLRPVSIAKTNYVHELQHALRLCNLNDLADNFKLK